MAAVVFILIALYEFDNAPIVDEKAPLFHDDYDPSKDYTIKHGNIFCANCKFFDGIDMCLLKVNFGKIGDDSVKPYQTTLNVRNGSVSIPAHSVTFITID